LSSGLIDRPASRSFVSITVLRTSGLLPLEGTLSPQTSCSKRNVVDMASARQSLSKRRHLAEPLSTADDAAMNSTRFDKSPQVEIGRDRVRQACHRCRLKKLKVGTVACP
jgi:hypothetical protein